MTRAVLSVEIVSSREASPAGMSVFVDSRCIHTQAQTHSYGGLLAEMHLHVCTDTLNTHHTPQHSLEKRNLEIAP